MKFENLLLFAASVFVALLVAELGLRLFTPFPIHFNLANRIYDDKLAYRVDPSLEGIDENGFRNPKILETVDIATLGDSHTYGNNVISEESWPQQLAKMTNMTIYNFGVGGYGSLQYHYLMDEAVQLRPKHIILGLYVANDLSSVCDFIRKMDYWQRWATERAYGIEPCFHVTRWSNDYSRVVTRTAVGSLVAYAWTSAFERLSPSSQDVVVVREEMNPTIIKHRRILINKKNMDMDQENITLGFEITKDIIADAKRKSDLNDIRFSITLIPSKERVFFDYLIDKGYQLPGDYHELVENEKKLVNQFLHLFEELGIEAVDVKPNVLRELYESGNVYKRTDDGHPGRIGYKAYAAAIYDSIFKVNFGDSLAGLDILTGLKPDDSRFNGWR